MNLMQKIYYQNIKTKDRFLSFFAFIFTKLHIKANYVSISGTILMIFFIIFIRINPLLSGFLLILSIFCDSLDGVTARYQKTNSDKGKFIDVFLDNFNSFLFAFGLGFGNIANILFLMPYVYFMTLSKSFRVFINHFEYKTDWYFKPVAGFLPNFINYIGYSLFIIYLTRSINLNLNYFFIFGSLLLLLDSSLSFIKITKEKIPN